MPWCPKCRNEYKAGYKICADCGCDLVEELVDDDKYIAYFGTSDEIDNIIAFLEDNGIEGASSNYDEDEDQYELVIDRKHEEELKRALAVYFKKILPKLQEQAGESEDIGEEGKNEPIHLMEKNERYEKPEDRAIEYKSGAATLLLVGVLGLIALILADMGIINFPMYGSGKILINVVMGGMFVAFIILGLSSVKTYKSLTKKALDDNSLEKNVLEWADNYLTIEKIKSDDIEGETEEVLYFNRIKIIKDEIYASFPDVDAAFLEYISEKLYSKYFE